MNPKQNDVTLNEKLGILLEAKTNIKILNRCRSQIEVSLVTHFLLTVLASVSVDKPSLDVLKLPPAEPPYSFQMVLLMYCIISVII